MVTVSAGNAIELQHYIIDSVGAKGDSDAGNVRHTEDAGQIIIPSPATNTADLHIEGFYLKDGSGIIIKSSGQ